VHERGLVARVHNNAREAMRAMAEFTHEMIELSLRAPGNRPIERSRTGLIRCAKLLHEIAAEDFADKARCAENDDVKLSFHFFVVLFCVRLIVLSATSNCVALLAKLA
jgi:metal-responsive CopG/Arc/MetJ family transcriptional regulator